MSAPMPSADVAARRARWDALGPAQRAQATRRRQVITARQQNGAPRELEHHLATAITPLGMATIVSGAIVVLWPASGWIVATAVLATGLLVAAMLLTATRLGYARAVAGDLDLPDVIPPADDTSLVHRGDELGWQVAPRHLQVRLGVEPVASTCTSRPVDLR